MRGRQHELYGEYERLRVVSGTRAQRLTTFSSASVQQDWGWGGEGGGEKGSRALQLIDSNIRFHTSVVWFPHDKESSVLLIL